MIGVELAGLHNDLRLSDGDGAGIPAFYTRTRVGTLVAEGKPL